MSVVIPTSGALEEPISFRLNSTSVIDLLSVAAGATITLTVVAIVIANEDSSARLVSVWWTENSTNYLIFRRSVAANETVTEALTAPIRLYAKSTARKIKAQAAAADVVTVSLFVTSINEQSSRK